MRFLVDLTLAKYRKGDETKVHLTYGMLTLDLRLARTTKLYVVCEFITGGYVQATNRT